MRSAGIGVALVAGILVAGSWYRSHRVTEQPPRTPIERLDSIDTGPPPSRCGMKMHLSGRVSSRVTPTSYAIIDHVDGDLTHVTNVQTTTADALPQAGDRVEVWGVVECDGPRDHLVEARREVR